MKGYPILLIWFLIYKRSWFTYPQNANNKLQIRYLHNKPKGHPR